MKKSAFEEMGGTYQQEGDYLIPNLTVPDIIPIGIWGQRRRRYLREYRGSLYIALLFSGKLNAHLADIDHQAQEQLDTIIQQMVQAQGVTETLKAADPMAWVGRMNNIRSMAEEIVNTEITFA